jgi:ubiquitin-protein ligase
VILPPGERRPRGEDAAPAAPPAEAVPGVRLRRLKADYDRIVANLEGKTKIKLLKTSGNPPEKYQLEYLVKSLVQEGERVKERSTHLVEITLTRAYPRQAPQCRMLTPVFHPNIAPHAICVGDHWAAGETLGALVVRIGEILSFQSYNLKSPLNGEAARWVAANEDKLPLDDYDFSELLEGGDRVVGAVAQGAEAASGTATCANCGKAAKASEIQVCTSRHPSCKDCIVPCGSCTRIVCLRCRTERCSECGKLACMDCFGICPGCKKPTCPKHRAACTVCQHQSCSDCHVTCLRCKKPACLQHVVPVKGREGHVCATCAKELRSAKAGA